MVSDATGLILAVYGEDHLAEAQEFARSFEHRSGRLTFLHSGQYNGDNGPAVGQSISMKGVHHGND